MRSWIDKSDVFDIVVKLSGGRQWEAIGTEFFNSLDARVLIEARDIQITVGLEFKQGRLTVSKGFSVKPDLHIIAGSSTILDLCLLKIKFGLPYFFDGAGSKVLKKLLTRELIIKGLFRHFAVLVKLTQLFSVI